MNAATRTTKSSIGPVTRKPSRIDRVHVLDARVDHRDIGAGSREIGAERAADRSRTPDEESRSHSRVSDQDASPQEPVSSARVSSTAICHSASISSSER